MIVADNDKSMLVPTLWPLMWLDRFVLGSSCNSAMQWRQTTAGWRPAEVESASHEVPLENWDVIPDGEQPDSFREEPEAGESVPAAEGEQSLHVPEEDAAKASFAERVAKLKDVGVKHVALATPLLNRKESTVIDAVAKLYAKFRMLQIPLFLLKADRAREFVGSR